MSDAPWPPPVPPPPPQEETRCTHPQKRELTTITTGKKVFCMLCNEELHE